MSEHTKLLKSGQTGSNCFRRGEPMSRRYSIYSLALVFSVCLIMVFFSRRLSSSSPGAIDRAPFVDIGRTIQSWSSNEVDMEVSGTDNASISVESVINEQRQLIAEEMKDYTYPDGRYNISAQSLDDLVPELGGQPIRNIIITTWRSGSTFLGDVLNSHPGNFYHYEPLLNYNIVQIRGAPLATGAMAALRGLLNCDYAAMSDYLTYGKNHVWLFTHNIRLWDQCQQHPQLCWTPEFLTPFCNLFPFQSMKVVRLRLRLAEELLEDPRLNVRVLLLVRDPRGTLQSRKHREWCPGNPDCMESVRLCNDLVSDYSAAVRLSTKFPQRFRAVRYEDLSVEPYKGFQDLFQFFGLNFHPSVQEFLDTHTKVNVGGVSSTYRNSKSAPFHWRTDLTHIEVRTIQRACRPAMNHWGYLRTYNSTHQKEFNPLGDFTLS